MEKEYGISIKCGNCNYGFSEATYKLKLNTLVDGKKMTKEWKNLVDLSKLYGFDVNGTYKLNNRVVSLEGYSHRSPKYPVLVLDLNSGKQYKANKNWWTKTVITNHKFSTKEA